MRSGHILPQHPRLVNCSSTHCHCDSCLSQPAPTCAHPLIKVPNSHFLPKVKLTPCSYSIHGACRLIKRDVKRFSEKRKNDRINLKQRLQAMACPSDSLTAAKFTLCNTRPDSDNIVNDVNDLHQESVLPPISPCSSISLVATTINTDELSTVPTTPTSTSSCNYETSFSPPDGVVLIPPNRPRL